MNNKIVHIVESYGGGVFSSVNLLANGFAKKGYEVYILFGERSETPKDLKKYLDPRIKLKELTIKREINLRNDVISLFQIYSLLKKINPNFVHLHSAKAGFLGRIATFFLNMKKITFYSPRGLPFVGSKTNKLRNKLYLILEKVGSFFGNNYIACSQSEMEEIEKNLSKNNVRLIENAIDGDLLPERKKNNKFTVVNSGRLCEQKNPELFLESVKNMNIDNIRYVWLGGGDKKIEKKLVENNIEVTGWVKRKESLEIMAGADIYVQTSKWEGMPLAVIESQCIGVPCIVTNCIGNRDIVMNNQTGFIVETAADLCKKIEKLFNNQQLLNHFSKDAKKFASERFSKKRIIDEYEKIYASIS